ncbi:MAG: hypothetical protein A3H93_06125 [Rhodocyclales bacterium RIFCSPLOWO2_02_FULL_63_24]|nr:MAG: hypothetical protein A2040_02525 [Rhodocyclales bacterium GWA2_65_19]OHC72401.1 MAG: hypothetical protein A3H93_06125 [Rhodocyclales bacterium RIFCSPLOWO2_02_FULL_63_24]
MTGLKVAAGVLALLVALLLAQMLFPPQREPAPPVTHGMPWQIEHPGPGQSRVFGLTLGGSAPSTLADALRLAKEAPTLALLTPQDAPAALEAYFESVSLGALTGKLVLSIAASPTELEAMRSNAAKTDHLETGIRKYALHDADRQRAERLPLAAIAFIPAASLDEAVILQRFGTPAERIRQGETLEHFLYPAQGLDIVLDSKGKEVLQYVAPAEFARLRAPLGK